MNVSLPSYLSKSTSSSGSCFPAFPAEFSSAFLGDFIFSSPSMLKLIKLWFIGLGRKHLKGHVFTSRKWKEV